MPGGLLRKSQEFQGGGCGPSHHKSYVDIRISHKRPPPSSPSAPGSYWFQGRRSLCLFRNGSRGGCCGTKFPPSRRKFSIPVTALHIISTKPIPREYPSPFGFRTAVYQVQYQKRRHSRNTAWIRLRTFYQRVGLGESSLINTTRQDRRSSILIPDGPLNLLLQRGHTDHTTSYFFGTKLFTIKGVPSNGIVHTGEGWAYSRVPPSP